MNVSEVVTNTIIKKLEEGHIPWIKPWDYVDAVNYVSQKPYAGINKLLLDGGEYLTFKQIKDNGGNIKPGSKAKIVVFYKPWDIEDKETGEIVHTRVMRYYNVFSIADVEGISKLEQSYSKHEIMDFFKSEWCDALLDFLNVRLMGEELFEILESQAKTRGVICK